MKKTSSCSPADASISQCTPSTPSTLAISCGSATTAVVPNGSTSRASSSTSSFTDSMCMCASMNPGTTKRPPASIVSPPSYRPTPAIAPSTTATSASSHSRVKTESTRPPRTTRSAASSPRATASLCARRDIAWTISLLAHRCPCRLTSLAAPACMARRSIERGRRRSRAPLQRRGARALSGYDLLIRGGTVVTPGGTARADVGVADGAVAAVAPALEGGASKEIDGSGLHVLPGVVDAHVHLNDPGRAHWEGFGPGTSALAAGGATCFLDMPLNAHPPTVDGASFDRKLEAARAAAHVDFCLWAGWCPGTWTGSTSSRLEGWSGSRPSCVPAGWTTFRRSTTSRCMRA